MRRDDVLVFFFFQAEDGIRDLVRSRGLGDVYKRQHVLSAVRIAAVQEGGEVILGRNALQFLVVTLNGLSLIHI